MGMVKILVTDIEPEAGAAIIAAINMAITMAAPDSIIEANVFNTDGTPYEVPGDPEEEEKEVEKKDE